MSNLTDFNVSDWIDIQLNDIEAAYACDEDECLKRLATDIAEGVYYDYITIPEAELCLDETLRRIAYLECRWTDFSLDSIRKYAKVIGVNIGMSPRDKHQTTAIAVGTLH